MARTLSNEEIKAHASLVVGTLSGVSVAIAIEKQIDEQVGQLKKLDDGSKSEEDLRLIAIAVLEIVLDQIKS